MPQVMRWRFYKFTVGDSIGIIQIHFVPTTSLIFALQMKAIFDIITTN
jgi:hypothetical protein